MGGAGAILLQKGAGRCCARYAKRPIRKRNERGIALPSKHTLKIFDRAFAMAMANSEPAHLTIGRRSWNPQRSQLTGLAVTMGKPQMNISGMSDRVTCALGRSVEYTSDLCNISET